MHRLIGHPRLTAHPRGVPQAQAELAAFEQRLATEQAAARERALRKPIRTGPSDHDILADRLRRQSIDSMRRFWNQVNFGVNR